MIHYLGNLTLLPAKVNAIFSGRDWKQKKALFRIIAEKDEEKIDDYCKAAHKLKIDKTSTDELRKIKYYLPMAKTISKWKDDFDFKHIDNRGENLMDMAWRTLSKWLDFK